MLNLTTEQRVLIVESYEQMAVQGPMMARAFYLNFFERHPDARSLFSNITVDKQAEMLMDALQMTVRALTASDGGNLAKYLAALGSRHENRYHVNEEDHALFRQTLLDTMAEHLGEAWTEDHRTAWDIALKQMSTTMHG